MAEKIFQTRILNKIDTYENWVKNNPVLQAGEIAIATIPSNQDGVVNAPSTLIKIGDGTSDYKTLQFLSGMAADVHTWAKAADKPTYKASEIEELADFIGAEIQDTNTTYKLEQSTEDAHILTLYSRELGVEEWTKVIDITTADTVYDDTAVKGDIEALRGLVGETAVAAQIAAAIEALDLANTYEAKGEAAKVQAALDEYKTANDAAVKAADDKAVAAQNDVGALEEKVGVVPEDKTVMGIIAEMRESAYDDTEVRGLIGQNAEDIKDLQDLVGSEKVADQISGAIEALDLGNTYATKEEAQVIADDLAAEMERVQGVEADFEARIAANEGALTTLNANAETVGSVDYKIAQAVAQIMENPDETMNSINELVTWINDHAGDALALSNQVSTNKDDIAELYGLIGGAEGTDVATQIADAILAALKVEGVDKFALATDLAAAIERIVALEGDTHTHDNKTVLDGITAEKVAAWDTAEENAIKHTDDAIAALEIANIGGLEDVLEDKANDADLAAIAKSGNVIDLIQTEGDVLVFDCGSASTVI